MFLSPLANLSVIQSMVVGIQIVASQLTCLMLHCSGHFLQTFWSVSHFLYSQKFYLVPSLQQGFNFFMTKTMFHILSPPSFIPFTLSFQSLSRIFFFFLFFFWGGPPHTLQYLSKIKVLARYVVHEECNVLLLPKCVILM